MKDYAFYFMITCQRVMAITGIDREGSAVGLKMVYQEMTNVKSKEIIRKEIEKIVKRRILKYSNSSQLFNEGIDMEKVASVLEEKDKIRCARSWIKNPEQSPSNENFIPHKKSDKKEKVGKTKDYISNTVAIDKMKSLLTV